ncbi:hypothetical protein BT96DRAFT_931039 [Gymnopus androsaceus JB14]|uniref:Uncharacterized protein n=1 Tax=Gymnopus androsaceus JB14 TaxID=1447944 RepID=A0A6A4IIB0_9AGAR|nr:hypothetical protein BT96DRAFT_931039 [Gymnopus androsaceus JB14]
MKLTASFAILFAMTLRAAASPVEDRDWKTAVGWNGTVLDALSIGTPTNVTGALEKRTPGGVYICTDINWGGECGYAVQALDACISLTSPWYDTISSFGPDSGAVCYARTIVARRLNGRFTPRRCNWGVGH